MAAKHSCRLSKKKIKSLLEFLTFIKGLHPQNRKVALKYVNDDGINFISESIYNALYNSNCTSLLSKRKLRQIVKTLKPNANLYKQLSCKALSSDVKRKKIIQTSTGLPLLFTAILPFLSSLLISKR